MVNLSVLHLLSIVILYKDIPVENRLEIYAYTEIKKGLIKQCYIKIAHKYNCYINIISFQSKMIFNCLNS